MVRQKKAITRATAGKVGRIAKVKSKQASTTGSKKASTTVTGKQAKTRVGAKQVGKQAIERNLRRPSKLQPKKKWIDTPLDKSFFVNDGKVLGNILELPIALQSMDAQTFAHHVNGEKNDFANWVEHVYAAPQIANKLRPLKSRLSMTKVLRAHL